MKNLPRNKHKAKVLEILSLAIDVSHNTKHDVFVDYSGHVKSLQVRISEGGWREAQDTEELLSTYLKKNKSSRNVKFKELNKTIDELKRLLNNP